MCIYIYIYMTRVYTYIYIVFAPDLPRRREERVLRLLTVALRSDIHVMYIYIYIYI